MIVSRLKKWQGFLLRGILDDKPQEAETEAIPSVFTNEEAVICGAFQTPYSVSCPSEILQDATQLGSHPQRADVAMVVLENKKATR